MGKRKDIVKERFYKKCPICNKDQSYGRLDHFKMALKSNWTCAKCGQINKKDIKWYNDIRISWWQKTEKNAKYRNIDFLITPKFIWDLYLIQDKKCALTKLDIGWAKIGQNHTASIDRIDSSVGYIEGNVWLVHKDINMMKQSFDVIDFIEYCKLVSYNN